MMSSTLLKPRTSARFASLMDLYEQNYMLVRLLAPALRELGDGRYVSGAGGLPLEISRVSQARYTTTFNLSYQFSGQHGHAREPDLTIRLYHDARNCEVMSGLLADGQIQTRRTRDLDEGYRLNRFVNRWLRYCRREGHRFQAVDACGVDVGSATAGALSSHRGTAGNTAIASTVDPLSGSAVGKSPA